MTSDPDGFWGAARAAHAAESRRRRREGLLLMLVSGAFVAGGLFVAIGLDELVLGAAAVLFFGGCFLAGVGMLGKRAPGAESWVALVSAAALGAGCLAMVLGYLLGDPVESPGRPAGLGLVIGAVGAVLFGGGAVLLAVRRSRRAG